MPIAEPLTMATLKLPPRQKMINMMYLVLTAILALNVSKEVLDSFVRLDADLVRSERSHDQQALNEYADLERSARMIPEKYREPFTQAEAVRVDADSLVHHIEVMKAMVIAECEGLAIGQVLFKAADGSDSLMALDAIERKDDRDALTHILVGSEPARPKEGPHTALDLKSRIHRFRDRLTGSIGEKEPQLTASLGRLFELPGGRDASGTENNWESMNFYDVPVVAGIAALSKLQSDIRSAESDVVEWLHTNVEADIYKVDRLMAAVIPQSDHVMAGDSFRADVFLAAYDSRNSPRILYQGAGELPIGADGKARLRLPSGALGEQHGTGTILFNGPQGTMELPYTVSYQVVAPTLVASPTKMNVLYRYVDNPIELSVPGVPAERVSAATSNGTIVRGPDGAWIARPGAGTDARIDAVVTSPKGGTRRIGPAMFRVRDLPAPSAYIAGKTSTDTRIERGLVQNAECVFARLVGTEFNAPFEVVSYELQVLRGNQIIPFAGRGSCFEPKAIAALKALRPGDRVFLLEVKARLKGVANAPIYALAPVDLRVL